MAYGVYRIRLRVKGAISAPWLADTLYGQLCWAALHGEGEAALRSLLDACRAGEPPFVLSDALPGDLFPKPAVAEEVFDRVAPADARETLPEQLERLSRTALLSMGEFEALRRGELFPVRAAAHEAEGLDRKIARLRAPMDRGAGSPLSAAPHLMPGVVPGAGDPAAVAAGASPDSRVCSVYVKAQRGWPEKVEAWMRALSVVGMGGGKSVGFGRFDVESFDSFHFTPVEKPNGFVSLSHFVPAAGDPSQGAYGIRLKRGRLGETYSHDRPFKKPLILLAAGSCFRTGSAPKDFYGSAVEGLSPAHPEVVQICYALALPMRLPWWGEIRR